MTSTNNEKSHEGTSNGGSPVTMNSKDSLMASLMLSGDAADDVGVVPDDSKDRRLFEDDLAAEAATSEEPLLFLSPDIANENNNSINNNADVGALILGGHNGEATGGTPPAAAAPNDLVSLPTAETTNPETMTTLAPSDLAPMAAPPVTTMASSLLAQSGLLTSLVPTESDAPNDNDATGGGLFDDIDREEQELAERKRLEEEALARKRQQEAQEAARRLQEEEAARQRAQEAALRKQQEEAQAAEALRQQQEQQQLLFQQQQQNSMMHMQNQMGSVNISPQQQQQQRTLGQPQLHAQPPVYYNASSNNGTMVNQQFPNMSHPAPPVQAGFYRDHAPMMQQPPNQQQASSVMQSSQLQTTPSNYYTGSAIQSQPPSQPATPSRYYTPSQPTPSSNNNYVMAGSVVTNNASMSMPQQQQHHLTPNLQAGMHNVNPGLGVPVSLPAPTPPTPLANGLYQEIVVTHPLLIQGTASLFGFKQAPHWSYQLTTKLEGAVQVWMVRRRFRHVVALEDRLRQECPGAILPPRPEKHAIRALEEASSTQSTEFAVQRAAELQVYLIMLAKHPIVHSSQALRLFLALQDDLGTAWPEVSSNALTRLANVGVGAAVSLSENASFWKESNMDGDYSEESAEILALQSSESIRLGAVLQAVPKMQGAATLWREHAEQMGAAGMELNRLSKEMMHEDRELAEPFEIVANGMLRAGRRSKRCSLELGAALNTFSHQSKLCRYEKLAFQDRKNAIIRRSKERTKADQRAAQLLMQQRSMYPPAQPYGQQPYSYQQQQQPYGQQAHQSPYGQQQHQPYGYQQQQYHPGSGMDRIERDAVVMDELAVDAEKECEEVGTRLKSEVNRVAWQRRTEWKSAVKIIASAMKEATSERLAIWESVRSSYLTAFPEFKQG